MVDPRHNGHGPTMLSAADQHRLPLCVGCGGPIHDQYILRVAPNLEWHAGCLKCIDCGQHLDETRTCFVRDGKTYCKQDYTMLFGTKCNKCGLGFTNNHFVMRARNKIFHIECFRCVACNRQLIPGDEFTLGDDGLFCKDDYVERSVIHGEMLGIQTSGEPLMNHVMSPMGMTNGGVISPVMPGPPGHMGNIGSAGAGSTSSGGSSTSGRRSHKDPKTTRIRTVLNEKQLHTLRTCYAANPRPDALMKEQLTEMTGLSSRVIRVWFQNKRCKDKKRVIAMKQMQDQHQNPHQHQDGDQPMGNGGLHSLSGMHGVPMVASEPVRNDNVVNVKPIEVRNYQQPAWKALSDFALQTEIEQPAFQQLVNNFSDHGQGSMSDSSDISSIPSVSSAMTSCSTPMTSGDINVSVCS